LAAANGTAAHLHNAVPPHVDATAALLNRVWQPALALGNQHVDKHEPGFARNSKASSFSAAAACCYSATDHLEKGSLHVQTANVICMAPQDAAVDEFGAMTIEHVPRTSKTKCSRIIISQRRAIFDSLR